MFFPESPPPTVYPHFLAQAGSSKPSITGKLLGDHVIGICCLDYYLGEDLRIVGTESSYNNIWNAYSIYCCSYILCQQFIDLPVLDDP
jgi:hypothetical protein